MIQQRKNLKTILQLDEADFRKAGKHGDSLMSSLREAENLINKKNNTMYIPTNLEFLRGDRILIAFNFFVGKLANRGVIGINVILDKIK